MAPTGRIAGRIAGAADAFVSPQTAQALSDVVGVGVGEAFGSLVKGLDEQGQCDAILGRAM